MKKIISILLILFSCFVSGCGREVIKEKDIDTSSEQVIAANGEYEVVASEQSHTAEEEDESAKPEQSAIIEEENKIDGSGQSMAANRTDEFVRNPYFYDKEEVFLQAKAKYFDGHFNGGLVEKTVYIQVDMLQTYEEGSVYKFTVDMDEKLVEWGTIVCQEDEMIEDQESVYQSITKAGNQVTYYAYSIKANGDIGWVLYYTWQEGHRLVSCGFRHGVGEGYDLTLDEIEELTAVG